MNGGRGISAERLQRALGSAREECSWWPVALGVVVLALAQAIYARGLELAEDAEGLV